LLHCDRHAARQWPTTIEPIGPGFLNDLLGDRFPADERVRPGDERGLFLIELGLFGRDFCIERGRSLS
jgi:hypothetical protein